MRTTNTVAEYMSQSLTASVSTEVVLMIVKGKYYFVEYPTNKFPSPKSVVEKQSPNRVVLLEGDTFDKLTYMVRQYCSMKKEMSYLHAPSFINGWCAANSLTHLKLLG